MASAAGRQTRLAFVACHAETAGNTRVARGFPVGFELGVIRLVVFALDVPHGSVNHQRNTAGEYPKDHPGKRARECARVPRQFPLSIESDDDCPDRGYHKNGCGNKDRLESVVAPPDVDTCHGISHDVVGGLTRRNSLSRLLRLVATQVIGRLEWILRHQRLRIDAQEQVV